MSVYGTYTVLKMTIGIYWQVRIKFLNLFLYSTKKKLKNLLVRTKFYWFWPGWQLLIVRTRDTISLQKGRSYNTGTTVISAYVT